MSRLLTEATRLEDSEVARYTRQLILPQVGHRGQETLKRSHVVVVGAGGLGCPILTYLAAAGVGKLTVVDPDVVDISNLHRQPLYHSSDIGKPKVDVAERKITEINPHVTVLKRQTRMMADNAEELLGDCDLVIDGTDNFAAKYLLNDVSVSLGLTLVYGSVYQFEGHVSVFNAKLNESRGPTYRCLFPEPPPIATVPSCAEAGVFGVLPGLIGLLQANEALKLLLGIGVPLVGRLLIVDALTVQFSTIEFERNALADEQSRLRPAAYYESLLPPCAQDSTATLNEISQEQLLEWHAAGKPFLLIDVREPAEKRELDLTTESDSAFSGKLIPLAGLLDQASDLPRDIPVVLYCRSGTRSQRGASQLYSERGFKNVLSLKGGALNWHRC